MSINGLSDPQWRRHLVLHDGGRVVFRAITPNDESLIRALLGHVSKEDLRLRFFDSIKEFSPRFLAGLIELDGVRARAFVATDEASSEMLGVVWLYCDAIRATGEYAILLRSDLKGRGLGWDLMQQENFTMLKMCRELGFEVRTDANDRGVCDVMLVLAR
jgi:hypothetical protein